MCISVSCFVHNGIVPGIIGVLEQPPPIQFCGNNPVLTLTQNPAPKSHYTQCNVLHCNHGWSIGAAYSFEGAMVFVVHMLVSAGTIVSANTMVHESIRQHQTRLLVYVAMFALLQCSGSSSFICSLCGIADTDVSLLPHTKLAKKMHLFHMDSGRLCFGTGIQNTELCL